MTVLRPIDLTGLRPAPLADQPAPQLIWADIDRLVVDPSYQRDISAAGRRAIQRIADGFDWRKFEPILVAATDGGKLAIVDGQHRAHAAALAGVTAVPAMTVAMTREEQARGFAAVNRDRIRLDATQIYRAELGAGDPNAVAAHDAVAAAGCTLATAKASHNLKKPGTVYAITLVRRMVANGEGEAVTAGLQAIRRSIMAAHPECYGGIVLNRWLPVIARSQRFLRADLRAAFETIDFDTLREESTRRAKTEGRAARRIAQDAVEAAIRNIMERAA